MTMEYINGELSQRWRLVVTASEWRGGDETYTMGSRSKSLIEYTPDVANRRMACGQEQVHRMWLRHDKGELTTRIFAKKGRYAKETAHETWKHAVEERQENCWRKAFSE